MPELPEVETLRRSLERSILGRTLTDVVVRERRLRSPLSRRFATSLRGRQIVGFERRSKYLWIVLDDDRILVVHLGMSGRFVRSAADAAIDAHTHVRIRLDDGSELRYQDPRRFGMLFVVSRRDVEKDRRFAHLGPEPLDATFDAAVLQQRAGRGKRPIKNAIMDAKVVVGVGNIYACESLYRARIHPTTAVRRVGVERWRRLHAALVAVLREAMQDGGTTLQDFRDADGRYGEFQNRLRVYGRAGSACERCGATIRRIVQAGRSTFYCPRCQK